MKLSPTWIIHFGKKKEAEEIETALKAFTGFDDWFVCNEIGAYITDSNISAFFERKDSLTVLFDKVKSLFNTDEIKHINPKLLRIILIGDIRDDKTRNLMHLFALYLRENNSKILTGNNLKDASCQIFGFLFTPHSWPDDNRKEYAKFIFELNMLQGKTGPKQPFDSVLFYKDTNTINTFGIFISEEDHVSRLVQAVLHLSLGDNKILNRDSQYFNYCTIGGCTLFYDYEELNTDVAIQTTNQLIKEFKTLDDSGSWGIEEREMDNRLKDKIREYEPHLVFNALRAASDTLKYTEGKMVGDFNAWFSPVKLKTFFTEDVRKFLTSIVLRRERFLTTTYREVSKEVKEKTSIHSKKLEEIGANPISLIKTIFEDLHISLPGLRKIVEKYKTNLEGFLSDQEEFYKFHFQLDERGVKVPFEPFPSAGKCKEYYDEYVAEFDNDSAEAYIAKEKAFRDELRDKLEYLPNPLAYFIRSLLLSTLFMLLAYLPLHKIFESAGSFTLTGVIIASALLFMLPVVWMTFDYKSKLLSVIDDEIRYEALVRYVARRRLMTNINNQMQEFYKNAMNLCDNYIALIDDFGRTKTPDQKPYVSTFIESRFFLDLFSKTGNRLNRTIECNIGDFCYKDDISDPCKTFSLWKKLVKTPSDGKTLIIDEILKNHDKFYDFLKESIKMEIENTEDNITSIARLIFKGDEFLLTDKAWNEIQNYILPFYNSQRQGDINWEVKMNPCNSNAENIRFNRDLPRLKNNPFPKPSDTSGFRSKIASFFTAINTNNQQSLKYIFDDLSEQDLMDIISHPQESTKNIIEIYLDTLTKLDIDKFDMLVRSESSSRDDIKIFFKDWAGYTLENRIDDESEFYKIINTKLDLLKNGQN